MPDDTTPDGPDDATTEPELDATPSAGTPGVTADEPGSVPGADDDTSTMAATDAGSPTDDGTKQETGILASTPASETDTSASDGSPRHAKGPAMSRAWVIALVAAVVVLAGAGIALAVTSGKKNTAAPSSHKHPTAATMIPAPSAPACPLTGLPAPGGQVPQRPALAYKVDNYPAARPQSGLTNADIVFEEPVEGGITRLVAVFQCQSANLVGPIRSARAIDVPILGQLGKPLFVHAGGINPVIGLVNAGNLFNDDVFTHASIVQHLPGRYAPYDTYASTSAAWALNQSDTTPPAPLYTYSATAPDGDAGGIGGDRLLGDQQQLVDVEPAQRRVAVVDRRGPGQRAGRWFPDRRAQHRRPDGPHHLWPVGGEQRGGSRGPGPIDRQRPARRLPQRRGDHRHVAARRDLRSHQARRR